jgi:hypothetical protein
MTRSSPQTQPGTRPARRQPLWWLAVSVFLAILLLAFLISHARAVSTSTNPPLSGDADSALEAAVGQAALLTSSQPRAAPASILLPPEQDTCLHCHISGEDKGLWTPLARWLLFGGVGLAFVFGAYRNASVWTTRSPWKPLTARAAGWVDERYRISQPLAKALSKPVPKYALRWWYCLGGITAFLFVIQAATGIMLAFYYRPTPEAAYASIQFIETQVRFGAAIRAIHSWSANGMTLMCAAHMLRVFIMGAYKAPRELNWVSGALLLVITLAFGFTGYLLPWDQRAFWATTVGTEIAGSIPVIGSLALVFLRVGWDVGALTLSRFYSLHVIVLPISVLATMGAHFLMVRRLGIAKPL